MLSVYTVLEQPGVSTPETLGDALLPASVLRGSEKPVRWGCGGISLLRVPGEGPFCSAPSLCSNMRECPPPDKSMEACPL